MESVLIVSPFVSEYGPRRTLEQVTRAVALAGLRPVCVLRSLDAGSPELAALEPAIRIIDQLGTVPRTLDPRRLLRFARAHRTAAEKIGRLAREENAVAVYTISEAVLAGGFAARRHGLPSVTHVIGLSIGSPWILARAYISLLDRVSSRFVACSTAAAAMLVDHGVDRGSIDLIHNSISLSAVDASARLPLPLAPNGRAIGMVAAYDPRKGHDLFVEAAALLAPAHPDARFYLIGGTLGSRASIPFRQAIRSLIVDRGLAGRVEEVGFVAHPDLYAWLRALDVVVAPSRTEGFAHALLEAMACSRPVVATAVEGNLDAIVHGESGLLVETTPVAIAAGVDVLLADPGRAMILGEAARARAAALFDDQVSIPLLGEAIGRLAHIERG